MEKVNPGSVSSPPMSEEECARVREQLERILETHHFKNSKRYPPLLRFLIEEALAGRGEFLKERLLGVRVFDRPADYDTASDPVVRVTIAEIRKRIAQYYHDEKHDAEIRIELLPGHYAPGFRFRNVWKDPAVAALAGDVAEPRGPKVESHERSAASLPRNSKRSRLRTAGILAAATVSIGAVLWLSWFHWLRPSALDEVWSPFISSHRPILFCLPTSPAIKRDLPDRPRPVFHPQRRGDSQGADETFLDYETLGENVNYSDMLATLRISNVLAQHRRDYHVRLSSSATFEDLRQGPAILIGGISNQWTMLVLSSMRYHFAGSDEDGYWISDTQNPGFKDWSLNLNQKYGAVTRDYAIIASVHNEKTGELEMVLAGLGMSGTAAAGEFMADRHNAEELRQRVGSSFKDRDFEAVICTDVIDGVPGSPRILNVWVQ